ncbi:hypothetical protein ACFQU2_30870 [Siccirubricoccus deserti]
MLTLATTDAPARAKAAAASALAAAGTVTGQLGIAVPAELVAAGPITRGRPRRCSAARSAPSWRTMLR